MGDRLGGHVVQGHVDGVGTLEAITPDGEWFLYRFRAPNSARALPGREGLDRRRRREPHACSPAAAAHFTVALIPHTLAETTLGTRRPGDRVNLEADVLLKQIAAMLRARRAGAGRPSQR